MRIKESILLASAVLLFGIQSCIDVKLEDKSGLPDNVKVNFSLDWPSDIPEEERPEQVYVAMSRIINTVHYVWLADLSGNIGQSYLPQEPGAGGTVTPADAAAEPDVPGTVSNGEYYIMAFNDAQSAYTIDALDDFASDKAVSLRDLYAVSSPLTPEEIGRDHADFNPAFGYVKESTPLFLDVKKQTLFPDMTPDVALDMRSLTQKITFRVEIEVEEGVSIRNDRMEAEISGVAGRIQLMSAQVRDSSYRVIFDMDKTGENAGRDVYEGGVDVLGLFPGNNGTDVIGAGILQLSIHAECDGKERLFHAGVNLSDPIREAGLMEELEDGSGYRAARSSATIVVSSSLRISHDQVSQGDEVQGVEIWFDSEDNDIDIEV